jgi:hypothetical protein
MRILIPAAILAFFAHPLLNAQPPVKAVPYDADLFRKDTEAVSAHGEFLYWTVQEGTLDFAQKMNQPAPSVTSYSIGKVKSASFDFDPGFRCAISYFNAPKFWEVRGQYTHLIARGKNRAEKPTPSNQYLTGTWPQIMLNPLAHAHSAIEFNYNLFDLTIDRMFIPNPHLRLRMIAGIAAAWIQQDWKVHYFDMTNQNTTIRNRWHYVGGGLRMGVMGDWFWGNDVYLTGLTSMGIFMGSYHNKAKQTTSLQTLPVRNSDFSDVRPAFTAQFELGPCWQKNFTNMRVEIFAGYELSAWLNLQEIRRSSGSSSPSDAKETSLSSGMIAPHGLTTRVTIDF